MRRTLGERLVLAALCEEMKLRGFIETKDMESRLTGYFDTEDQLAIMTEAIRTGCQPETVFDAILWLLPVTPRIVADVRGLRLEPAAHARAH
jgi:hypothetical protein